MSIIQAINDAIITRNDISGTILQYRLYFRNNQYSVLKKIMASNDQLRIQLLVHHYIVLIVLNSTKP